MGQITSNLLIKAFATWEHAFVCTKIVLSATFFKKLGFLDNKVIYIFRISCCCCCRFCFCLSLSVFSYLFVAVFDLLLGLLPVQEILLSIIEMGKLCHIVVKCTLEGIFTHICEHFCAYYRLESGYHHMVTGKTFSSYRTWVQVMSILVKGDDIRYGTKTSAQDGQLQLAQASMD